MNYLNLLEGIAMFRCVTTQTVASTWYAGATNEESGINMARGALNKMRDDKLVESVHIGRRRQAWILTPRGRSHVLRFSSVLNTSSNFAAPRTAPIVNLQATEHAAILARFARAISSIPSMRFICYGPGEITSHPDYRREHFDALIGIVASTYDHDMPCPSGSLSGRASKTFTPIRWTSWNNVIAVINANQAGNFQEIAGYYALEIDRETETVSLFERRARLYRIGRSFPAHSNVPAAPIPVIVTMSLARTYAILERWAIGDPKALVFAIDRESLMHDDIMTSKHWLSYNGLAEGEPSVDSVSPFHFYRQSCMKA